MIIIKLDGGKDLETKLCLLTGAQDVVLICNKRSTYTLYTPHTHTHTHTHTPHTQTHTHKHTQIHTHSRVRVISSDKDFERELRQPEETLVVANFTAAG